MYMHIYNIMSIFQVKLRRDQDVFWYDILYSKTQMRSKSTEFNAESN